MAVDNETVKRVAFLSRLKVEDDKIDATKEEFNKRLEKCTKKKTRVHFRFFRVHFRKSRVHFSESRVHS